MCQRASQDTQIRQAGGGLVDRGAAREAVSARETLLMRWGDSPHFAHFSRRRGYSASFGLDSEKIVQTAMNIAAIIGPITKPLSPKIAMPPSVEISTT